MSKQYERVLFLGLGGAGQRHLRVFRKLLPHARFYATRSICKTPFLKSDFSVDKSADVSSFYDLHIVDSLSSAWYHQPQLAVIALPTSFHASTSIDALAHGLDVFVEKPGVSSLGEFHLLNQTISSAKSAYFISFQRRFHPNVQKTKSIIQSGLLGSVIGVQVQVSSYVPEWHPYENFLNLYACRADLGGGVVRTECHELDLIQWFFGMPEQYHINVGQRSQWKLDVEDSAEIMLVYPTFGVQVSLSFMQMRKRRLLSIDFKNGWLNLDLDMQLLSYHSYSTGITVRLNSCVSNPDSLFEKQAIYFLESFKRSDTTYVNSSKFLATLFSSYSFSV
jgi:predicted dehydrogenase